jgi:GT2 family glycosyltransferase
MTGELKSFRKMTQNKPVVILGVIYKSYMEAIRFVESIERCFDNDVKVILVDNSEITPDPLFIEKIQGRDFITYLKSEKNSGYFHGAKSGMTHYLEKNPVIPQWIIVCNVDIILDTPLLSEKLGSCENVPNLGVIAPAIISSQWKTDYNPFRMNRIPLKKLFFYRTIYSNFILHNGYLLIHYIKRFLKLIFLEKPENKKSEVNPARNIYAPHGSCVIFNKNYFERGGTLDHISFLFGEEIFVGETAKKFGLNILYFPDIIVRHYEHSSIGNFISPKINTFYKQSIVNIIDNYYQ